ncbi:MAG TPA: hypothetical protein VF221_23645 [Chloroflexota bacterium]
MKVVVLMRRWASVMRWGSAALMLVAAVVFGYSPTGATTAVVAQTTCAVTQPDPAAVPPASIDPSEQPAGLNWRWYGNRFIWTQLPPNSTVLVPQGPRHLASVKFPWWRIRSGTLSIRGHPVGASGPRLSARIPAGYGSSGFQSTGINFPSYGCWRVIGSVRGKSISFVLQVEPPLPSTTASP